MEPRGTPTPLDGPLGKRLQLISGLPAQESLTHLRALADDASSAPSFDLMSELCRTLSDRNRLLIAAMLKRQAPLSGTEIQAATGLSQPTVSHHMRALVGGGLVEAERAGKWTYYRLDPNYARLVP